MSMSSKDFQAVADAFQSMRLDDEADWPTMDVLAERIADVFEKANGRFDRVRFLKACGNAHVTWAVTPTTHFANETSRGYCPPASEGRPY